MRLSQDGRRSDHNHFRADTSYITQRHRMSNEEDHRSLRKIVYDNPNNGPLEGHLNNDQHTSHCRELAGGRAQSTPSLAHGYNSELPPITKNSSQHNHCSAPPVGRDADEERRNTVEPEDQKKANIFKRLSQRIKERTVSRRSEDNLQLARQLKRNGSVGSESTQSITFIRRPLDDDFRHDSAPAIDGSLSVGEPRDSGSGGTYTSNNFSDDSHLDCDQHFRRHCRYSIDSVSEASSHDEEVDNREDSDQLESEIAVLRNRPWYPRRSSAITKGPLFYTNSAEERASRTRSCSVDISGPFNPVHIKDTHRRPMLSAQENMRQYREIFHSVPAINTAGKRKSPSSGSGTLIGTNRVNRLLKFFHLRKTLSEETTACPTANWKELPQAKGGPPSLVMARSPHQQQDHNRTMVGDASSRV